MQIMPAIRQSIWITLTGLSFIISPATHASEAQGPGMSREVLMKQVLPPLSPSTEARVIRVLFPSGFKTPLHTHEGPGPRYVLKGKLRVEDAGKKQVYGPGEVFWETGAAMTIENISGGDAEMVIFELAPH